MINNEVGASTFYANAPCISKANDAKNARLAFYNTLGNTVLGSLGSAHKMEHPGLPRRTR